MYPFYRHGAPPARGVETVPDRRDLPLGLAIAVTNEVGFRCALPNLRIIRTFYGISTALGSLSHGIYYRVPYSVT